MYDIYLEKHMKLIKLVTYTLLFFMGSSLAALGQVTTNEQKVSDIEFMRSQLRLGQHIILDHGHRCGYHPKWLVTTNIRYEITEDGEHYITIPLSNDNYGLGCNSFPLESLRGIEIIQGNTVIRSIHWVRD